MPSGAGGPSGKIGIRGCARAEPSAPRQSDGIGTLRPGLRPVRRVCILPPEHAVHDRERCIVIPEPMLQGKHGMPFSGASRVMQRCTGGQVRRRKGLHMGAGRCLHRLPQYRRRGTCGASSLVNACYAVPGQEKRRRGMCRGEAARQQHAGGRVPERSDSGLNLFLQPSGREKVEKAGKFSLSTKGGNCFF